MRVGDLVEHRTSGARYRIVSLADTAGTLSPPVTHFGGVIRIAELFNGQLLAVQPFVTPRMGQLTSLTPDMVAGDRTYGVVEFFDWQLKYPQVASMLNLFPEVKWDRFTEAEEGIEVYGWIDRDDGRSDFLALDIRLSANAVGFVTSSAALSEEFGERLGFHSHNDCIRVEDRFGELVSNYVKLAGT